MNEQQMKSLLSDYLVGQGILDSAAMEAKIKDMAAICPAATAAEKGLTTDVQKAYEVMMIQSGSVMNPPSDTQVSPESAPAPTATSAEKAAIKENMVEQAADRQAVSNNSRISKYLLSRPAPADQIPAGAMGDIDADSWKKIMAKISSGEYTVLADYMDEKSGKQILSQTNFEKLKAAAENGEQVAVHIGEQGKRPTGYIVVVGGGAEQGEKQMTRTDMQNFITWKGFGYILPPNEAGVRLKTITPRASANNPGQQSQTKVVMQDINRQTMFDAGKFESIRTVNAAESKVTTAKSELSFQVNTTNKAGKTVKRTIRASVKLSLPVLVLQAQYQEKFSSAKKDPAEVPHTPEQILAMANNLTEAIVKDLYSGDALQLLKMNPDYKASVDAVEKLRQPQAMNVNI